jgi:hypothetical protein
MAKIILERDVVEHKRKEPLYMHKNFLIKKKLRELPSSEISHQPSEAP